MHLSVGGKSGSHAWSVRRQWKEGLRVQELFGMRSEPLNRCGQDKNTTRPWKHVENDTQIAEGEVFAIEAKWWKVEGGNQKIHAMSARYFENSLRTVVS